MQDAWEQEQQMAREKRQAKKESTIYKRWHNLLTKALLRQRVADEAVVYDIERLSELLKAQLRTTLVQSRHRLQR